MAEFPIESEQLSKQKLKYELALEMLMSSLEGLVKEFEINNNYNPVEHIKSRIKKEESAIKKLENRGYELTLDNLINHIHDMVGVRIVCSFLSDVYDIVNVIKKSEQFIIKEERDYIKEPKDTGYISYHFLVSVPIYLNDGKEYVEAEIQVRTVAMDFWASLDHKIQYKFCGNVPKEVAEELYKCAMDIKRLDHRMLDLNMTVNTYNDR